MAELKQSLINLLPVFVMCTGFFLAMRPSLEKYRAVLERLKKEHEETWIKLGRPEGKFGEKKDKASYYFLFMRYKKLNDPKLNELAGEYWRTSFVGLVFVFLIGWYFVVIY